MMRAVMWTLIIMSGFAALMLSFNGLQDLATMVGLQPAGLFPVSVDITTTAATIAWLKGGPASRTGKRLALFSITISVLLNAVYHLMTASGGHAVLASVVAAVGPIMLAAVVHLGALEATPQQAQQEADEPVDSPMTSYNTLNPPLPQPTPKAANSDLNSQVAALLKAADDAGVPRPGRPSLAKKLGVTEHQVGKELKKLRQLHVVEADEPDDDQQGQQQVAR